MTDRFMKVDAKLHGLSIRDASADTMYKDIICSVGQSDVLVLEFVNYIDATKGQEAFENMKNVDTSVKVRVSENRFYVVFGSSTQLSDGFAVVVVIPRHRPRDVGTVQCII